MKSFDEISEYLNEHDDRCDYQIHSDRFDGSIRVEFPRNIYLFIDVKRYRVDLVLNESDSMTMKETRYFLQYLHQAMKLGEDLEKFLQSL